MSEWKEYKLGDIASFSYGKLPKHDLLGKGSYVTFSGYKYIERYPEYNCEKGDVILVARGVGGTGDVKITSQRCFLTNLSIKIELDNSIVLNDYFYNLFRQDNLRYLDSGSAQSQITIQDLANVTIEIPPIDEQQRIAGVLSSLDDKIDLLNRENATLEALAETLFRHYFIENPDPTWKEVSLSSIATFLNGLACQKYPPKDLINRLPVLKIKELSSGITKDSDWATTDVGEEYIVHSGDVIFAWSASLMVKMWNGEDCVLNQHLFKVTSDIFPRWYYYLWCKYHLQEFISIAQSHATTMGHIKRGDLDSAMVLVPSRNEMETFTKQIEPLLDRVEVNYSQINNLSIYRDNLLPHLMNGELKVYE